MTELTEVPKQTNIMEFLKTLIDSKKLPVHIKTVEDAFTVAQMGKELGFATMQAMHYIIPIQGRLTLSAKATAALLRKGKVQYKTVEDGVWVYRDGSALEIPKPETEAKPYDRRTTISFMRDGVEEICSYTWKEAEAQGLTVKDNWKKLPREMLYARCLAKGANRIGADLLLGLYLTDEMADAFNVKENVVIRDEEGNIKEITE